MLSTLAANDVGTGLTVDGMCIYIYIHTVLYNVHNISSGSHACMYVCTHACTEASMYVRMWTYAVCTHTCVHAHKCMYVCMYVCMCTYIYIHPCMCICISTYSLPLSLALSLLRLRICTSLADVCMCVTRLYGRSPGRICTSVESRNRNELAQSSILFPRPPYLGP